MPSLLSAEPGAGVPGRKGARKASTGSGAAAAPAGADTPSITAAYGLVCQLLDHLCELVALQPLEDAIVTRLSGLAVQSFFVDGALGELQTAAIDVLRAVFARYPAHQPSILEDLLASIAKVPASRRNVRAYRSVLCVVGVGGWMFCVIVCACGWAVAGYKRGRRTRS